MDTGCGQAPVGSIHDSNMPQSVRDVICLIRLEHGVLTYLGAGVSRIYVTEYVLFEEPFLVESL